MKFKELQEGKLYKNKHFSNIYTIQNGLLYHIGNIWGEYGTISRLQLEMYYVTYSPEFILDMDFTEVILVENGCSKPNTDDIVDMEEWEG